MPEQTEYKIICRDTHQSYFSEIFTPLSPKKNSHQKKKKRKTFLLYFRIFWWYHIVNEESIIIWSFIFWGGYLSLIKGKKIKRLLLANKYPYYSGWKAGLSFSQSIRHWYPWGFALIAEFYLDKWDYHISVFNHKKNTFFLHVFYHSDSFLNYTLLYIIVILKCLLYFLLYKHISYVYMLVFLSVFCFALFCFLTIWKKDV